MGGWGPEGGAPRGTGPGSRCPLCTAPGQRGQCVHWEECPVHTVHRPWPSFQASAAARLPAECGGCVCSQGLLSLLRE